MILENARPSSLSISELNSFSKIISEISVKPLDPELLDTLNKKLVNSAFRRGASAFRFGLLPMGVSDHLPIKTNITLEGGSALNMLSWNLLADQHLYNNFMNISGSDALRDSILDAYPAGVSYCSKDANRLYHFFSELAQYLYSKKDKRGDIQVTDEVLQAFASSDGLQLQNSLLTRSRDPSPEAAQKRAQEVIAARKAIIDMMTDRQDPLAHELRLAIRHSLELIHHIQNSEGGLKWNNRFKLLQENKALTDEVVAQDMLCLQECTNPEDIKQLFQGAGKRMEMIVHRINGRTNDHCVLMFNPEKVELIGEPIKFEFEAQKPGILAQLRDKASGKFFILGSMHHPGGNKYLLPELLEKVEVLRSNTNRLLKAEIQNNPYFIFGDHNHTKTFFDVHKEKPDGCQTLFPEGLGTMAGSDYGNVNCAIDALTTDNKVGEIKLQVCNNLQIATPMVTPLQISFKANGDYLTDTSARMFHRVETDSTNDDNTRRNQEIASSAFAPSNASMAPRSGKF